jgi:hypothetical protein
LGNSGNDFINKRDEIWEEEYKEPIIQNILEFKECKPMKF